MHDIVDPSTKENVSGYAFYDNNKVKIYLSNVNIPKQAIRIKNYIYDIVDNYNVKLLNFESSIYSGDEYLIVPEHTFEKLKNTNNLNDKLFCIECYFDKEVDGELEGTIEKIYFRSINRDKYNDLEEYAKAMNVILKDKIKK